MGRGVQDFPRGASGAPSCQHGRLADRRPSRGPWVWGLQPIAAEAGAAEIFTMQHSSLTRTGLFSACLLCAAAPAMALTPSFDTNWPASITASNATHQVAFSNLPVLNTTGAKASYVGSSAPTNVTGFSFNTNMGFVSPVTGEGAGSNNLILYVTPGTYTNTVTNTLRISITNAPGSSGASTNIDVVVPAAAIPPPYLEIRFYNRSTNPDNQVYILPSSKQNPPNPNFWWVTNGSTNSWTNHMGATKNMSVTLADIGVTGTNLQGRTYHSVYTTNFNNAAWWVSYGGGNVAAQTNGSGWNGNVTDPGVPAPTAANAAGTWAFSQWNAFEITLAGSAADVGDLTFINQFSIPMTMRVFTNSTRDSDSYYQHGGWTNFTSAAFGLVASNLLVKFPNAVGNWRSFDGSKATLMAFPSSAAAGTLVAPVPATGITNDSQNSFPKFTDYFAAVRSNTARTNVIGDMIAVGAWHFYYSLGLSVTPSNGLVLSGSMRTTNTSTGATASYSNLVLSVGPDAGPRDNWASWTVYAAPTTANFLVASNGVTNVATYTATATNVSLRGQPVLDLGAGWGVIATNTGTSTTTNTVGLYDSDFGKKVVGRIMGDMAAGFALGFINSDATNMSYQINGTNAAYGDSPSGAWWGGNQYPSAKTNRLVFGGVQPALSTNGNTFYSQFAGIIYSNGTTLTYVHPIYDRMAVLGGGAAAAGTPQDQLQPSTAINGVPPVWVVELDMYDGLLSAPQPALPPAPGAMPHFFSPTNTPTSGVAGIVNTNYASFVELSASNMAAPASWVLSGLPAGMTYSNSTNGGVVYCVIHGAADADAGAAGQDGGRVYAVGIVMSNSYGLAATNLSSPLNPTSLYIQINTTNALDPSPGLVAATSSSLPALSTMQGSPSVPAAYLVSAYGLATNLVSVSPPSGFEVSTNASSGYTTLLSLLATNGTPPNTNGLRLAAAPLYVRLIGAPSGAFGGYVTNASPSVAGTNVAVSGVVSGLVSVLPYSNWLTNYPSVAGTNTNAAADPDGDAFANIVEYAFDGDPSVDSPAMFSASNAIGGALFRYVALKGADTNYAVQATGDLIAGPWTNTSIVPTNAVDQSGLLLPESYERKEFFVPYAGTNGFYRVTFTNL